VANVKTSWIKNINKNNSAGTASHAIMTNKLCINFNVRKIKTVTPDL
jgi:hypothetical protein